MNILFPLGVREKAIGHKFRNKLSYSINSKKNIFSQFNTSEMRMHLNIDSVFD
jgi:hypothetical protein